ncbi:IucA/IucC family siderophore biosynthesis protein [Actinoplanes sp. NEAU-A12]|uniref:IucA/IucC family siderophore biosynthesis protein n=1 Tax=Actinoplanes sandaracinus TaxID=3045177 RepID=A0ABT6WZ65_9ACTN|nr:IucA/IucC family siderophore biosynthesis protein [Actinoplanes sandaracinus]MDI6105041.1 IucA/IucC family siderophore biosynthesis protein [Actinoplanes sandaracinus]
MPPPTPTPPPHRHTADPAHTRHQLAETRPDLLQRYDQALPAARTAILARLLIACETEPLPAVTSRHHHHGRTHVHLTHGTLSYPTSAATPFTEPPPGLTATFNGTPTDDPAHLTTLLWPTSPLATEIANSVANLALARAANPTPPTTPPPAAPGLAEQLLTDGHPLHPCCRTRTGMTVTDVLAYAPEHHPVIRLQRLRVPPERWHGGGEPVLLAHPWQATRLREQYPWLTTDGTTGPVRPLMSLRTVAPLDGGPHIKTAVDIQMTSAVRTVSPAAVDNGPRLSALLHNLTADLPLDVLTETAAGAVITDHGPDRRLAHLIRQAPPPGAVPLGVLTTTPAYLTAITDPYTFMKDLGQVLFAPLARLLERGVALEAHGQNTLLLLHDGRPVRTLYRDLGGVRVHPGRLTTAGHPMPPLHGDLPTDDHTELRTKLAAAALATVARQTITALTHHHHADPDRLWQITAAALHGTTDTRALLTDPLPVKATTAMRLATNPLHDQWTHLPNPMAAHA